MAGPVILGTPYRRSGVNDGLFIAAQRFWLIHALAIKNHRRASQAFVSYHLIFLQWTIQKQHIYVFYHLKNQDNFSLPKKMERIPPVF